MQFTSKKSKIVPRFVISENQSKYQLLRQEYNVFTFERFDYTLKRGEIHIKYTFNLSDIHLFEPEIVIHLNEKWADIPEKALLDNLIFQIGMIELVSYWKATCSPKIIIKPYLLDSKQIHFWKNLYFHGLGEFFYVNGIVADQSKFVEITCKSEDRTDVNTISVDPMKVLVPIGGGKDSIVTLELLKNRVEVIPFIINPRKASVDSVKISGIGNGEFFRVDRIIHPNLIELNSAGFLNGHTPFSALVGFLSLLAAALSKSKYIALSNESSANEPTVINGPNHQYSKSYSFESDFRDYVFRYISPDIKYFSFLRPLEEIEIAHIFSRFPKYFRAFKSCNVGSKKDIWCGHCPKCLFTAIILSPFIDREEVVRIFGHDILDSNDLIPTLEELIGATEVKPFECVGTVNEVNRALIMTIQKFKGELPSLLEYYKSTHINSRNEEEVFMKHDLMGGEHFLEEFFAKILEDEIDNV